MPVFTPINPPPPPPPASRDDVAGRAGQAAPAARLEEEVRALIHRYQAALRKWLQGQHADACAEFGNLAESALLSQAQEAHVESECSAYCKEHGGLSIARLRSLVLANAGVLRLTVGAGGLARRLLGGLAFDERSRLAAEASDGEETAVREALAQLMAALPFDQANAAHRLAAGQCALALGHYDIAVSVLGEVLGPGADAGLRLPEQRWGPLKWWCARAAVQAALMRGDVGLAAEIVESTSIRNRSASGELQRLFDSCVVSPARSSAPAVVRMPGAGALDPPAAAQPYALTVHASGDAVSLATLGEAIVAHYKQCATGCPAAGAAAILGHVPLEICAETAVPDSGVAPTHVAPQVTGDMSEAEADARDHRAEPGAECHSHTDAEDTGSGPDCFTGSDVCRAPKRRASSSSSSDERPAKRRSTRFSERAGLIVATSTYGAGGGNIAPPSVGGRAAAARGGTRHALTASPTAAVSAASKEASESALAWLRAIDAVDSQAAADAAGLCAAVAEVSFRQAYPGQRHRAQGRAQPAYDKSALADWNMDLRSRGSSGSKGADMDALDAALQSIANTDANYHASLVAHLRQQCSGQSNGTLPDSEPQPHCHSLGISKCRALVDGNSGVFDLLLRYMDMATEAYCASPLAFLGSPRLKLTTLAVARIAHGLLLDRAAHGNSTDGRADDVRQGIRCGTLVILLVADPLAGGTARQQQNSAMRTQWVAAAEDAIGCAGLQENDPCVTAYRIAAAWTDYEAAAASNDVAHAATSVAVCADLLQRHADSSGGALVARCSLSGMPVTVELARQRQAHLEFFGRLAKAADLARADEGRAIAFLRSIAEPFADSAAATLAFPQQIAAARLLAALCDRQGMPADRALVVLYELHLYLSRLLAAPADGTAPIRPVISRCAECLQTIHAMAATAGSPVDQYLDSGGAQVVLRRVVGQLVPMAIALVNHFEVSPAGAAERPATSPEARFVGLAAWLAARVVACTPLASPPVRSSGEPAAAPSECSDDADALDSHMRFLSGMHGLLGERGLCTAAGGAFLKHVFLVCQQQLERGSDSPAHWDVAGSCLRCMFDIKLHSSSGSTAERHPSVRVDMDQQLANAAYLLVEPELLDALRSRKGAGLRSDLKAVVDKADSVLGSVDIAKHPRLAMNMDAIDDYLDGATMPTFAQLEHALRGDGPRAVHVACVPLRGTADGMGIPAACLSLPFVRATMQHDLLLSRMRSGLARAVEDYDEIIEDYKLNVSLSPASAEAWHHLGQAHSDLADELLLGTASEVLDSRHDIATLLRSALSCVLQAKQLLEPIGQPSVRRSKQFSGRDDDGDSTGSSEALGQLHGQVYSLAGWLLYRIAARPLPMLALEILPSNILVADDDDDGDDDSDADHDNDDVDHGDKGRGSRQAWDVGTWCSSGAHAEALSRSLGRRYSVAPPCSRVYALAHEMLLHATRLEPGSWKPVYMLGKATGKLGRPLAACALYLKACHLACAAAPAPLSAYSMPGGAADAMCKLLSTLAKLVWSQKADAATAQRFLDALPITAASTTPAAPAEPGPRAGSGPPESPRPAAASLFAAIRDVLDQVCAADKRRRHHRSAFLLAWMSHHVFSDPERAKHALLGLLQMRGAGKQLASFYKTDFEAAGKHYLYLEKYLALYIDTLAATRDIDGIRALARKLPRSADMLYDAPAILRRVGTAEMAILQSMVRALSCPRVAVAAAPGTSDGQIVLQVGLDDSVDPQTRAVFRHCRLNRTQFNYARDFARENIVRIMSVRQQVRTALTAAEAPGTAAAATAAATGPPPLNAAALRDALASADRDTTDYLETADKAIALFGHLLDQKKHASNPEELSQLNDCVADVYALVLSTYGQSRCVAPAPLLHEATPADACRHVSELLAQAPRPAPPGGPFWQCITFDETRHDGSQQYRLLDPLLEFQVNKLLDSVRAAQAHLGSSSPDASADPAQGTQQLPAAAPAKLPASGEPAADGAAA